MRIRKDIYLKELENYGYHYEENLFYPTYQKKRRYGNKTITIDILILNRKIFINKSDYITKKNINFVRDLIVNNLVEK